MAKKTNYLPWLIGGVAAAWLLLRKSNGVNGIGAIRDDNYIAEKIDFLNHLVGSKRYEVKQINKNEFQLFDKLENKLLPLIPKTKMRFTIYLSGFIEGWGEAKGWQGLVMPFLFK